MSEAAQRADADLAIAVFRLEEARRLIRAGRVGMAWEEVHDAQDLIEDLGLYLPGEPQRERRWP